MKFHCLVGASLAIIATQASAEPTKFREGEIIFRTKAGNQETITRYLWSDAKLRIDRPGTFIPAKPVNLIDLKTGDLRILRPHNSTWLEVPAEKLKRYEPSAPHAVPVPTGIGAHHPPPHIPGSLSPLHEIPGTPLPRESGLPRSPPPANIGLRPPGSTSGRPQIQPLPDLPQNSAIPTLTRPNAIAIPPVAGPASGLPPAMVRLDASSTMTLTPGNETRTLHGYPCKKYTLRIPHIGIMTLWLSNAADLPPFHLLTAESPRRRGRGVWQEKWPTLIRHNQSFPMLALLETSEPPRERTPGERAEESPGEPVPRQEIMRWEVLSVGPKDPEDTDGERFSVPAGFHHTEPFQF